MRQTPDGMSMQRGVTGQVTAKAEPISDIPPCSFPKQSHGRAALTPACLLSFRNSDTAYGRASRRKEEDNSMPHDGSKPPKAGSRGFLLAHIPLDAVRLTAYADAPFNEASVNDAESHFG